MLPPILVELKANSSELKAKLGEIQGEFQKTASEGQSMASKIKEHFGAVSTAVGGTLAGAGAALSALGSKDQAAHKQLQQAVENTGKAYDDYKERVESTIKSQEKFGNDASQTQDAIRILTQQTGDAGKAMDLMSLAANLAAAKHESLDTAATQVAKTLSGSTRLLKEFGVGATGAGEAVKALDKANNEAAKTYDAQQAAIKRLSDLREIDAGKTKLTISDQIALRDAQQKVNDTTAAYEAAQKNVDKASQAATAATANHKDAITQLSDKLNGQAAAASDTFMGKLTAMKTHVEDVAASLGQRFGPALQIGGGILMGVGQGINGVSAILDKFKGAQEAATVATEGLTAAEDAEAVSSGLALGPLALIVAAVVAVGVAIFELWTHWSTVWGWIKGAVSAAWSWIHDHIVLILTVALGPLGFAIGELGTHWSQVWDGIKNAVSSVWDFISGIFSKIKGAVGDVGNAIKGIPGSIVNAIPGAGLIKGVLGHLATGGTAYGNSPYIVGENGPELFVPGASGAVVPNHALGGGGSVTVGSIVVQGASDPQATAAAVRAEILRLKRSNVNGGLF